MESPDPDDDWDSDDMSAGARLMRYNIADEPRPHCQSSDLQPRRRSSSTRPPLITRSARFSDDKAVSHHDFAKLKDDGLYKVAARRHSSLKSMPKTPVLHPRASLSKGHLAWLIANRPMAQARWRCALKSNNNPAVDATQGTCRQVFRQAKRTNTRTYRPRTSRVLVSRAISRLDTILAC